MNTSVEMRGPIAPTVTYVVVCFLVMCILWTIYFLLKKKPQKQKKQKPVKQVKKETTQVPVDAAKKETIKQFKQIQKEYESDTLSRQDAYQKMSSLLRGFVDETLGLKTRYMSLQELKTLGRRDLADLIEEYYEPAFSQSSDKDVLQSIQHTIKVIEKWK